MSLTVTFHNMDNPQRSLADLQLFLIFCYLNGASSRARSQHAYMRMINYLDDYVGGAGKQPFEIIRKIAEDGKLDHFAKKCVGSDGPRKTKRFFQDVIGSGIDLRTATRDELVAKIKGLSVDRASMFVMFRDQNSQNVVIDKDVRRWMRDQFNALGMQDKVPGGDIKTEDEYKAAEQSFFELARLRGSDPRSLNLQALREVEGETRYDRADEKRIRKGGERHASHWDSRISRNDISLPL